MSSTGLDVTTLMSKQQDYIDPRRATLRQRWARRLRRYADKLDPLPTLILDGGDPWGATEIIHCTLLNNGIRLPLTIRPVNRMPAAGGAKPKAPAKRKKSGG